MAAARSAGLNVYLPAYLAERLKGYARRCRLSLSAIVESWLEDADVESLEASWGPDFRLPAVGVAQIRLALRITPEARHNLNLAAQGLQAALGGETVSARRLVRWLVEYRLQALGEL